MFTGLTACQQNHKVRGNVVRNIIKLGKIPKF